LGGEPHARVIPLRTLKRARPHEKRMSSGQDEAIGRVRSLLMDMGLNEYQALALAYLLFMGEAKPLALSKASGVPSARIYGILDELVRMGLVVVRPGRPAIYVSLPPEEVAENIVAMHVKELERKVKALRELADELVQAAGQIYLKGKRGMSTIPLLRIVSVGEASLVETKRLYDMAREEILIMSRAMEYLPDVAENLRRAVERGVSVKVILMRPDLMEPEDREKQAKILRMLEEPPLASVLVRFSDEVPIRGCIIDPGKGAGALFLVEDPGVPFSFREAAITFHPSVVRGLALMFSLMWDYKAIPRDAVAH